jgi:hypothetical protein
MKSINEEDNMLVTRIIAEASPESYGGTAAMTSDLVVKVMN